MPGLLIALQALAAAPIAVGLVYLALTVAAVASFQRLRRRPRPTALPRITLLKPVCGLEKHLEASLRSMCRQDYPTYQVLMSVQREDDPALPLLRRLESQYPHVEVVVGSGEPVANGKIHNLVHAMERARHEVIVLSDSDVAAAPDYLRKIVAPLADPKVGFACTLYRGVHAERWYEKLELLSLHEFTTSVVFARQTGASPWCLGSSLALRRSVLDEIGGFAPLAEYLAEDYEMGRRICELGYRRALLPYSVETTIDLARPRDWWRHQLYWDLNTRLSQPIGFAATVLVRPVPFAILFAALRGFDLIGTGVLLSTLAARLLTAALNLRLLGDREGMRHLAWLPARDVAGLAVWFAALRTRRVTWRGVAFTIDGEGRMVPQGGTAHGA